MLSPKSLEIMAVWLFGRLYKYDKVFYPQDNTDDIPVEIICPEHGPFWRTQTEHIMDGLGCPECGHESDWKEAMNRTEKTTIEYVDEFGNELMVACRPIVVLPGAGQ